MNLVLQIRPQPDPNDFFGVMTRFQRRPVTVTSPTVEINVLPLPAPVPAEFTGAIGSFTWNVAASPTNLSAGDPITLRAVVSGRGNLDNVKLPEFNSPGFRAYQPTSTTAATEPLGIEGSKNFEQVLIPQSASVTEIPAIALVFFDPDKKTYVTLREPAVPLQVKPGAGGASAPSLANAPPADEEPVERADIVHIKSEPGSLAAIAPPLIQQPWFLALQSIPLFGVIGLTLWRKRQDELARNPKLRRKLEVRRVVQAGLVELRQLAAYNQPEQFYALLFRLMQEQIGERLDLPASAITEAVLDERLPRRGASPDQIERLHHLFQISNQARYAPLATNAELLSLSSDLEKALNELQQLPDRCV
jgi:hypothetical protein